MTPANTTAALSAPPAPARRHRRAADLSAARLGRVTLAYLAVTMGIITLAPFHFASAPVHGLTAEFKWLDVTMNVLMFLPFGFIVQLTRPAHEPAHERAHAPRHGPSVGPAQLVQVFLYGALLSGAVETAQLFEVERYSSLLDVTTNAVGAVIGAALFGVMVRRIEGENAVRNLALELPLMGLVYLLVPLCWLIGLVSDHGARGWLALPIAMFAGSIMGTVHAAYLAPSRGVARASLLAAALLWFAVALLPGVILHPALLVASAVLTMGSAWTASMCTARSCQAVGSRRFELPTLRVVMPFFAAYLALSSLWPLNTADATWRGSLGIIASSTALQRHTVYLLLEHVAAFTLVGYLVAEFYGRDLRRYRDMAPRVLGWGGGISLLLETTRGWHPAYGASLLTFCVTIATCLLGGWIYQLQREHVRALLRRRGQWSLKAGGYTPITNSAIGSTPIPPDQHALPLDRRTA